jgi:hypothetical protein
MRRRLTLLAAVTFAMVSVRCSSPSAPAVPKAGAPEDALARTFASAFKAPGPVSATFVIDGFRVHPDPGADGVIHVTEGDGVVVNGADIASRPPAAESILVVNWGDGGNERVGCGACRLTHSYVQGKYSVTATVDDLQPGTTKPSTTFKVDVAPAIPKRTSPFAGLAFTPNVLNVGGSATLFLPLPAGLFSGSDIIVDAFPISCSPPFPAPQPIQLLPPSFDPEGVTFPVIAVSPGSCTLGVDSHDSQGNVFHDRATITVIP